MTGTKSLPYEIGSTKDELLPRCWAFSPAAEQVLPAP